MSTIYYTYNRDDLLTKKPAIPLKIFPDNNAIFKHIALQMADTIEQNNASKKSTVFICPVGPVGQYPLFIDMVNTRQISLKSTWFINMDEYLTSDDEWMDLSNSLSFRGFMQHVHAKIDVTLAMPPNQQVFPDPKNPSAISTLISKLGGVDVAFGGIGINGHLAFNEPQPQLANQAFLQLPTRTADIAPETRCANTIGDLDGALELMPHRCITIGMKEIFSAKSIQLGCFRPWHRGVVRRACFSQPSSAFPVSLLQSHPNAYIFITELIAK